MPRDEFKTQVLLLHSEHGALDSLGADFGDHFTVHYATSGSEALQTLGETPINVIVSVQNLPGMSGREALREAKRRSPETIGILLAEGIDDGQEALVSDAEVFEVVRGNVTSDTILKLVDSATQQLRLMTLGESANDTAADVKASSGELDDDEHVILETGADGQPLVSDGSGRLPVLDSKKASQAAARAEDVDLLLLTKDESFLKIIENTARDGHGVHYANTLAEADEIIRKRNVGVTIIDAGMIGKRIEQLVEYLRRGAPRLVFIVAGRRDDGEMLMDLINRGKVYRFLLKPVSPGRARLAIEASSKHHLDAPDLAFADKISPAENPAPATTWSENDSTINENLRDVFGGAESLLKETFSGLISTIGEKLSTDTGQDLASEPSQAVKNRSKEKRFLPAKTGTWAAGIAVVATLAAASLWFMGGTNDAVPTEQTVAAAAAERRQLPPPQQPVQLQGPDQVTAADAPVAGDDSELVSNQVTAADVAIADSDKELGPDQVTAADAPVADGDSELVADPVTTADAAVTDGDNELVADPVTTADAAVTDGDNELVADPVTTADAAAAANENELVANQVPQADVAPADGDKEAVDTALRVAERALLESRLEDAEAALQQAALLAPDNARLPFMAAQLRQAKLRAQLSTARSAIVETRFEDADTALANARSMDVADGAEIDAVAEELAAARSKKLADDVLAMANARLQDGALLSPANNNARYFFELALVNDPANTTAREGLSVIASKLALQARAAIENGDLGTAQSLLSPASALEPSNSEVVSTQKLLASARSGAAPRQDDEIAEQPAAQTAAVPAETPADEKTLPTDIEPAQVDAALAGNSLQTNNDAPAANPSQAAGGPASTVPANVAGSDSADEAAPASLVVDGSAGTEQPRAAAASQRASSAAPVMMRSLNRLKYVAPKYPRAAQRRNLTGWVDVVFTVTTNGTVKDIKIRDSKPGETFVAAATRAVEKWEFEPVVENGSVVEKRAGVRMMFALE